MEQKRLGSSRAMRQPLIISKESWRSSCKASRLMIKVGQSNQTKRRSWTYGLKQLVACIRGESMALDQSLVSVVVLLDCLVLILRHIARLILDEFEQLNRKVAKITKLYLQERAAREEEAKRKEEEDRRREEEERRR